MENLETSLAVLVPVRVCVSNAVGEVRDTHKLTHSNVTNWYG